MCLKRLISVLSILFTFACVPAKKYAELESLQKTTNDLLNSTTVKLNLSEEEKNQLLSNLEDSVKDIQEESDKINNRITSITN